MKCNVVGLIFQSTLGCVFFLALACPPAHAYPVDGYADTGIRRLDYSQRVQSGEIKRPPLHPGQYLPTSAIVPSWSASDGKQLPVADAEFSRAVADLIPASARGAYGLTVLDLSDPKAPVYGAHNGELLANVGSVGKIMVALALFQTLADLYPNDLAARARVLKDTQVLADSWSQYDHHKVPFWDPATKARSSRSIRVGDTANLYEFLDWTLSASSNSAAAVVQKELLALRHFGKAYPASRVDTDAWFAKATRKELGDLFAQTMNDAAVRAGLDPEKIRQGSFFTRTANQHVDGKPSYGTPDQLLRFLFRLEAGTLVDAWSSTEIKRLLYITQRRIRYASHPALNDSAVYFKSGSYYQCHKGPRGCAKYKGNKTNRLASVAIVESPAGTPPYRYLVAVMSNVLHINSAVAHQTLALRVQRLIESRHPAPAPVVPESAYPQVPVDDPGEPGSTSNTPP